MRVVSLGRCWMTSQVVLWAVGDLTSLVVSQVRYLGDLTGLAANPDVLIGVDLQVDEHLLLR